MTSGIDSVAQEGGGKSHFKAVLCSMPEQREEKERHHDAVRKKSDKNMATQSQGIKQLMAAEKEAAQVVANARKSKLVPLRL